MKLKFTCIIVYLAVLSISCIKAQTTTNFEFDTLIWNLPEKYQILEYEGKQSLLIELTPERYSRGYCAYLKDYEFSDGIIEFDMFCPQNYPSYIGFVFRLTRHMEENRHELFYFRPFMSNSMGAIQYIPVHNGYVNWPSYADNVYKSAGYIPWNEWIHVKADIEGPKATVFINDTEVMTVENLGRGLSKGSVGVILLSDTPKCYFANFTVSK